MLNYYQWQRTGLFLWQEDALNFCRKWAKENGFTVLGGKYKPQLHLFGNKDSLPEFAGKNDGTHWEREQHLVATRNRHSGRAIPEAADDYMLKKFWEFAKQPHHKIMIIGSSDQGFYRAVDDHPQDMVTVDCMVFLVYETHATHEMFVPKLDESPYYTVWTLQPKGLALQQYSEMKKFRAILMCHRCHKSVFGDEAVVLLPNTYCSACAAKRQPRDRQVARRQPEPKAPRPNPPLAPIINLHLNMDGVC